MSLAGRVRDVLGRQDNLTAREVADALGVQSRAEVEKVRQALTDLKKAGYVAVTQDKPQRYRLLRQPAAGKQEKLWRACQVQAAKGEAFSPRSLAVLAGCSLDYAKRYLRWLKRLGLVEASGASCRLAPGAERLAWPKLSRRAGTHREQQSNPAVAASLTETIMGAGIRSVFTEARQAVAKVLDDLERDLLSTLRPDQEDDSHPD